MKIHLLEVGGDIVFWALETTLCHPETKTIPGGDVGPLAAELNRWTLRLLTEESRETAESPHFKNSSIFYYPALFRGHVVHSEDPSQLCFEEPLLKYAAGDLLMHNILHEDRYKCFTWEHKLGLSCWCMLLVLTGLFQLYSSHVKCPCHDWSHIIPKGKMTCGWMSFFTPSNEKRTLTHTHAHTIKVLMWQSWMSSLTFAAARTTTVLSIGKCHFN